MCRSLLTTNAPPHARLQFRPRFASVMICSRGQRHRASVPTFLRCLQGCQVISISCALARREAIRPQPGPPWLKAKPPKGVSCGCVRTLHFGHDVAAAGCERRADLFVRMFGASYMPVGQSWAKPTCCRRGVRKFDGQRAQRPKQSSAMQARRWALWRQRLPP